MKLMKPYCETYPSLKKHGKNKSKFYVIQNHANKFMIHKLNSIKLLIVAECCFRKKKKTEKRL